MMMMLLLCRNIEEQALMLHVICNTHGATQNDFYVDVVVVVGVCV